MKASDYIVSVLKEQKVKQIFGYQGANISHIVDSICETPGIDFVESYNEQGASFCANGYAQVSNHLGVAIASSGPGAINLLSGIADAYFDSIPCLFITGNVGLGGMRKNEDIRQNSFQELDIVQMTKGITKFSVMVDNVESLPNILLEAIRLAFDGRKGAVHLDIPHNIQKAELPDALIKYPKAFSDTELNSTEMCGFIEKYIKSLENSQKPLLLIGSGLEKSVDKKTCLKMLEQLKVPYVASLKGLGTVDYEDENYIGFIGDYGNRYANIALYECDNLLILGSRLDHRQTGADLSKFAPNAEIFRIEIDKNELTRVDLSSTIIQSDVKAFVMQIQNYDIINEFFEWKEKISDLINKYPSYLKNTSKVHVNTLFHYLSKNLNDNYIICGDVGQTQMAIAQAFHIKRFGNLLNSGGLGSMGYALPCAIGAKYASPKSIVIAIAGDGGIQMNLQELQMIQRDKLPIKIIVVNNHCLGMIRQYQKLALDGRFHGSLMGYENPDFASLAKSYGLQYLKVDSVNIYEKCLDYIVSDKASFIEILIDEDIELMPEMGRSIIEQIPLLK